MAEKRDDLLEGEEFTGLAQEAHAGMQQQLYWISSELRRLRERVRTQGDAQDARHLENRERLEDLERVVVKGNGELSLVRRIDRVQAGVDEVLAKWREHTERRRWALSDVAIPVIAIIVVVLDHFWK